MTAVPAPVDTSLVPRVWARYTNIVVDHGEGSWLISTDGQRYLDYSSGIGVTSTGHAHPRVVEAITNQAARLLHGQQNIVFHDPGLRLHARLAGLLKGGPWQAFMSNSGAEAVEAAVKLARVATGRPVILSFRGGFHGRTGQTMALSTSRTLIRGDFEPLPGSIYHAVFPYCYRAAGGPHRVDECTCDWETQLETLFAQVVEPATVAAIIVEPVMGEGGYIVPPASFLPRLRALTAQHGMLLIADEVQTGIGRTGRLFAIEHVDVTPDIVVFAKGIASGLPLSGIIARQDLLDAWRPGAHGGTYGGNVVSCAAALATLDVIDDEGLVENARVRGGQLLDGLRLIQRDHPVIGDVRGLGLMAAMEFVRPGSGDGRTPAPEIASRVIAGALQRNLIILSAGAWGQVVRLIPPLVTTQAEIDLALGIITEAVAAADA
jgi:4-aminobutyrate aminotransferase